MTDFLSQQIPPPTNWQDFENLCADLWQRIWNDPDTQKHGRKGQSQHGVDVYGRPNRGDKHEGVQCKGKDGRYGKQVTGKELRNEIEEAKKFTPKISKFILATTAPNDEGIQKVAREITETHRKKGLFDIVVLGWDEIQRRLSQHPEVIDQHYPDLGPRQQRIDKQLEKISMRQEASDEQSNKQHIQITEVIEKMNYLLSSNLDSNIGEAIDKTINEEIDRYRDLIKAHQPQTALNLLEHLKSHKWNTVGEKTKFRVLTNIAAAKLALGISEEAARGFLEAKQYNSEDVKATDNVALAYMLLHDWKKAIKSARQAIKKHPDLSRAYSFLVSASIHNQDIKDPCQLVPPDHLESAEVVFAIGHFYHRRGFPEKALFWMQKAYELNSEPIEIRMALAELLLNRLIHNETVTLGQQFTPGQREDLKLAHKLLATIWNKMKSTEVAREFIHIAYNLSNAKRLLNEDKHALRIIDEASQIDNSSPLLKHQWAVFAMQAGNFSTACAELKGIPELSPEQKLLYVEALRGSGHYQEALSYLDKILNDRPDPDTQTMASILHLQVLKKKGSISSAISEVSRLIEKYPKNIRILTLAANLYASNDDQEAAKERIQTAKKLLTDRSRYSEWAVVADCLFELGLFDEAIPIYEYLVTENNDSLVLQRLMICLYETDRRKTALERLFALPDDVRHQPFYRRLAIGLYLQTGELDNARENCEAYLELKPDDLKIRFYWLQILYRQGDHDGIRKFLAKPIDLSAADVHTCFFFASILDQYGKTDNALRIAYETRRKYMNNPQAHLNFINFLIFRKDIPHSEKVDVDTAFTLEDPNGKQNIFIIDNVLSPHLEAGEITPEHPIAKKALGCKIGDSVLIKDEGFFKDERRIIQIQHKYLYALNDSRENFQTRFPTETGLTCLPIKTNSGDNEKLQPILSLISQRSAYVAKIEGLYQSQPLPIGFIAKLLGVNPFDAWMGLMNSKKTKIICCLGTEPERQQAFDLIESNTAGYVIDPITLFALDFFQVQKPVTAITGKLGITQSSLDLLNNLLDEREGLLRHEGFFSLSKEGKQLFRHEVTEKDIKNNIQRIEEIIEWTKENCEVLPARGTKDLPLSESHLKDHLHAAFIDSLLAAEGSGRALLSDDLRLRSFGKSSLNLNGVWLQPVLIKALQRGLMPWEDYAKSVIALIRSNHCFITIDKNILFYSANPRELSVTEDFKIVASTLGGENIDSFSALKVAILFLLKIWGQPLDDYRRENFVCAILNYLKAERTSRFDFIFRSLLSLPQAQQFRPALLKWCRGHFIPFPEYENLELL